MGLRSPECSVCTIINADTNDDVTLLDGNPLTKHWRVALMENQGALGAMYLTTRVHRSDLDELTPEEAGDLMEIARVMTGALKAAFNAAHTNFACDMNEAAARHESTHVHFKLRGRYDSPVTVDGKEFYDEGFGTKTIRTHRVGRQILYIIRDRIEGAIDGH